MEHREEVQVPTTNWSFTQKASVFLPTALTLCGAEMLLRAPAPLVAVGAIGAGFLAYKSPEFYEGLRKHVPLPAIESKAKTRSSGEYSFTERLMGKHYQSNQDSEPEDNEPEDDEAQPKDERDNTVERARQNAQAEMQDDLPQPPSMKSGKFVFSSILKSGFVPALDNLYLATTMDGTPIYGTAEGLCHVALAGSTGGGKSSLMRLLMAQLCKAGAQVLLLNPHYTRYDLKSKEDWTPFEPYLVYDPMECRKYDVIAHYLKYTAETLLPRRLERFAHSQPTGKPYYLVMDELPSIIKHVPDAPSYLGELLREGRKVGIYLIAASQDFLVKTIAPDGSGGAIRDCYRTAYYVGGDATTGRILLDMESKKIPEDELGKGCVMLRCADVAAAKKAVPVRVPYVDNNAIYSLLGPSTYKPTKVVSEEELNLPPVDELVETVPMQKQQKSFRDFTEEEIMALIRQSPDVDLDDARYSDEQDRVINLLQRQQSRIAVDQLPEQQATYTPPRNVKYQKALDAWNAGNQSVRSLASAISVTESVAYRQMQDMHKLGLIQMRKKG